MLLFWGLGFFFLCFSGLFFFAPNLIIKISEIGNKLVFTDEKTVSHRYWTAALLLFMSIVMFYLGAM